MREYLFVFQVVVNSVFSGPFLILLKLKTVKSALNSSKVTNLSTEKTERNDLNVIYMAASVLTQYSLAPYTILPNRKIIVI